jgi:flagellin-specific chaperone FliS
MMSEPQLTVGAPVVARPRPADVPSGDVQLADVAIPEQYELLLAKLACAEADLDAPGRSGSLEEASGIVFDLLYSLDFKKGGELVPRLAALYGYIGNELLNVGKTRNKAQLVHLRDMITTLRQSWQEQNKVA